MAPPRLKKTDPINRRVLADIPQPPLLGTKLPPLTLYASSRERFRQTVSALYQQQFALGDYRAVNEYLEIENKTNPVEVSIIGAMLWKERGAALIKETKYGEARAAYAKALQYALAMEVPYETPSVFPVITALERGGFDEYFDAIGSANNIAFCYLKENNVPNALEWLNEVECMHKSFARGRGPPRNPWAIVLVHYEDLIMMRIKGFVRQTLAFEALGNSAASSWRGIVAALDVINFFPDNKKLFAECPVQTSGKKRHPHPEDLEKLRISEPSLQVRGIWKNIVLEGGPPARRGYVSLLHRGKLYVFGNDDKGLSSSKTARPDRRGWKLDVRNVSNGWSRVPCPSPPMSDSYAERFAVHKNKAFLFQGPSTLNVFDLDAETWSQITTEMKKGEWRTYFPTNVLLGFAVEVFEDKMYVFGGRDSMMGWGSNLFMVLDLNTRQWEHLSGTAQNVPDYRSPSLRGHFASWLSDGKMYITLGIVNLTGVGGSGDHHYYDIWSYDISSNLWTEEKMTGNPPCIRSQSAHTFNTAWNRAIVFGGFCSLLPFNDPDSDEKSVVTFNLFADTFVWNPENKRWSQVITRGFPTYRCCANMMTDGETGKTYLFGGYTNTLFIPSRSSNVQKFLGDLWELVIDVPGGGFDESEFESDLRFSKLGPYVRCFNCGSVGRWKMCAGSCKSTDKAAAFCGTDCQRVAWSEHKQYCRKV